MKHVSEHYQQTLAELAETNVNPQRYAAPVVAAEVVLDLPEITRVYQLPPFRNSQAWTGA